MIKAEHFTKYYPPPRKGTFGFVDLIKDLRKPRETLPALVDVNFEVKEGEIFGLLGPNGAGKTTFCKIMNALVIPTSGHIYIDGCESVKEHEKITREMVTIFGGEREMWGLFSWRVTVERNLKYIADLWKVPSDLIKKRIEYALQILDLEEKRKEWYQKLSAGMKQKVHLSLAFIVQPKIIVLDEPTIRLDVPSKRKVHDAIKKELCQNLGSTVLLTTHDMSEADKMCDRVAILNQRIEFIDKPENIKELSKEHEILELKLKNLDPKIKRGLEPFTIRTEEVYEDGIYKMKIFFEDKEKNLPEILGVLRDSRIEDIKMRTSSLEDAFIYLINRGKKHA
ncbi:MAG: ABC transporter ATP-binding protein [Methanomicrobia archaeon]|nr:ABC transporter ATP-binding protein [Methanomicrobia archaeon]